ncbi:MAG: fatty acid desaturase [Bdellovibrionaceae bacterium]|nr:fatty acid desaturase [Pseudobdellovibrionaceae bacterium]
MAAVQSISPWLYPIAAVVIANRALALSLLCHESIHGNLHKNRALNDWLGRYLCGFPTLMSLSRYRRLHLLHHSAVGSAKWDPDRNLYDFYPTKMRQFLLKQISSVVSLKTLKDFLSYYTDWPELLTKNRRLHVSSDVKQFTLFHLLVGIGTWTIGLQIEYLIFWIAPIVLITQPYVLLMGGLQHGPARTNQPNASRTILGSKLYMWLLLPCDINFHAEHHLRPNIPHYHLKRFSESLLRSNVVLWKCSYRQAIKDLFQQSLA